MDALAHFIEYLAQAYDCRGIETLCTSNLHRVSERREPVLTACRIDLVAPHSWPEELIEALRRRMQISPVGVVVVRGAHCTSTLAYKKLSDAGLDVAFFGAAPSPHRGYLAVLHHAGAVPLAQGSAPREFRVVAIIPTFNEEDIISQTLRDLGEQGLQAYIIDNWSTDGTVAKASAFLGNSLIGIERFPASGPAMTYDLFAIMSRVEAVAAGQRGASWVVLHDADERRRSPWPGVTLRDALWYVDRCGYSCIDHTTLNFWPVDDSFDPEGLDLEQHFAYFSFSDHPGHFHQRRAWKQLGMRVALAPSAGHDVSFMGRRVYPYKFLLKHYPIRSQAHGVRKLRERFLRWNSEERALGWHRQYDDIETRSLLHDPAKLIRFEPNTFYEDYLAARLSGAGIFAAPPPWATPPRW